MKISRIAAIAFLTLALLSAVSCAAPPDEAPAPIPTSTPYYTQSHAVTPDAVVPAGQSWAEGNWAISFGGAEWYGCTIVISVSITYTGYDSAIFGQDREGSIYPSTLYIRGGNSQQFYEDSYVTSWYQQQYYPQETRSGTLQYTVGPQSGSVSLYIDGTSTQSLPGEMFDLGNTPGTCKY